MAESPEEKERRRDLLQEIWKLEQEVGLAEDDLTIDEILAITEQVRKELAEKHRKRRAEVSNLPDYHCPDCDDWGCLHCFCVEGTDCQSCQDFIKGEQK